MKLIQIKIRLIIFMIAIAPIQLHAQLDLIDFIIVYKKDKEGEWVPENKYEYFYDINKSEVILSYWNNNSWINKQKRVRENTNNSDSIIVKYYKKENLNWELGKMQIGVFVQESNDKIIYEVRNEHTDGRYKKKAKRMEKNYGKRRARTRSEKKGDHDKILNLLPSGYIHHIIRIANEAVNKEEKIKQYSPLRCGMSKQIIFNLHYDDLDRVERFNSEELKGIIKYKNGI